MPPKKAAKRKAADEEIAGRNAATAKRVALENEKFIPLKEMPYEARTALIDMFDSFAGTDASDGESDESDSDASDLDDFEIDDDGYKTAMRLEEEHERRVEKAHRHLAIRLAHGEKVQAGDVQGEWDLFSPNLLDLRDADHQGKTHVHFQQWKTGNMVIGDPAIDFVLPSTEANAVLSLDGLENDWHIPLNLPKLASLDLIPLIGARQNYKGAGNAEVRLGISFLGNGYLKMRIPGIRLVNNQASLI